MKLKDKVSIVTGASSGIGRDIAYYFAKEGATVYAVARRIERLEELSKEAKDLEGEIIPIEADLMSKEKTEEMIEEAYEKSGKLDILVNNAGIMDDFSPIGDVEDNMIERIFKLNVYSPMYAMRKAVNIFLENDGGNIINISSLGGLYGARAGAVYTASKHALTGLTKNTAFMYSKKNIRANEINPGGIATEVGSGEFMQNVNKEGIDMAMSGVAGNPREGQSNEIASIAVFLASDDSSYINGESIKADGGWTAY